jgi:ABC-type thiamine transport system ATPase subunit
LVTLHPGGERKRLSVVRALLSQAPVLLLEGPTAGLVPDLPMPGYGGCWTVAAIVRWSS